MLTIEKRLPFGFRGEWGQVYKIYTPTESEVVNTIDEFGDPTTKTIEWQSAHYADIGQDVQFKHQESGFEKEFSIGQAVANLIATGEYRYEKTTDSFFDGKTKTYQCVVEIGDIVNLGGEFYVCESVKVRNIVTPAEHNFYYVGLRKIYDVILTGVANA